MDPPPLHHTEYHGRAFFNWKKCYIYIFSLELASFYPSTGKCIYRRPRDKELKKIFSTSYFQHIICFKQRSGTLRTDCS